MSGIDWGVARSVEVQIMRFSHFLISEAYGVKAYPLRLAKLRNP